MSEVVPFTTGGNPFEIAFAPAKPVLNAVLEMREPLAWLNQHRRSGRPLFEPNRANDLIDIIPKGGRLATAGALFLNAAKESAPEQWLHIVVGLMMDSEPSAADVRDTFRYAVADGAYRDPDIWEDYGPGFSPAVVVKAVREARLLGALPSPGTFLKLCIKHRRQFRTWNSDTLILQQIRYEAEDELEKLQPQLALTFRDDDWGDDGDDERVEPRPPGWRPTVYPDDDGSDCSF